MGETQNGAGRGGAPRWMTILLVVSLGLNLLVLGAALGLALKGGHGWRGGPPSGVGALHRALGPEDREVLRARMKDAFRDAPGGRAAFRGEMDALVSLLRAESFDAAAADAHMAQLREMYGARMDRAQGLLVSYWDEMGAEARAAYADRLEAELQRRRR